MHKFIGLKSKCYCHQLVDSTITKTAKGTKKCVVKNAVCFEDYENCLFNHTPKYVHQHLFRNKGHKIFTNTQYKKCLSFEDDKRCILEDGITSYAWGHYNI